MSVDLSTFNDDPVLDHDDIPDEDATEFWTLEEAANVVAGIRPTGGAHYTEEEVTSAWQFLINTGDVWNMGSWFSKTAQTMIDSNECTDPRGRRH